MTYADAMSTTARTAGHKIWNEVCWTKWGSEGKNFQVFDQLPGCGTVPRAVLLYRKQLDELTEFVKRPRLGQRNGMARYEADGTINPCR